MTAISDPLASGAQHASVPLEPRQAATAAPAPSKYAVTPEIARRINARRVNARRAYEERGVLRELGLLDR